MPREEIQVTHLPDGGGVHPPVDGGVVKRGVIYFKASKLAVGNLGSKSIDYLG